MIEVLCFIALVLILWFSLLFLFASQTPSKIVGWQTLLVIASIFVVFSLFFEPKSFIRWDLIEHFKVLQQMKIGGLDYVTKESIYADLFIYNFFAYGVSSLPSGLWNLLSTIPLAIDFAVIIYIYKTMYRDYFPEANGKVRILSVILWLFTFGIKLAITGIRCSLAVSLVVLAIYLEMIQKKKKPFAFFLYAIAVFIHNFALAAIFVRILSKIKKPIILMLGALAISVALEPLAQYIVDNTSMDYLRFSFERILATIDEMSFSSAISSFHGSTLVIYLCFIFFSIYLFFISWRARRNCNNENEERIVDLAIAVGAVAVGLSFNYLYLERFMYFLSFVLLMIIPIHNKQKRAINIENFIIIPIALFMFFFNDIYIFMVNYTGVYFLAVS